MTDDPTTKVDEPEEAPAEGAPPADPDADDGTSSTDDADQADAEPEAKAPPAELPDDVRARIQADAEEKLRNEAATRATEAKTRAQQQAVIDEGGNA